MRVERIDWHGGNGTLPLTIFSMQSVTGIKFLAIGGPETANVDRTLSKLYRLYTDWALKNPFYILDMPVRNERFDAQVEKLFL
jgi:hypothetical protein